jgi:hypothetical protein
MIRHVVISTGEVISLAGKATLNGYSNGVGTNACLDKPGGIAFFPSPLFALFVEYANNMMSIARLNQPHRVVCCPCCSVNQFDQTTRHRENPFRSQSIL